MTLRVVLLAEGSRETGGELRIPHAPGETLDRDLDWGPAHHLVERTVSASRGVPSGAVWFAAPLRTGRGTIARGTQLYDPGTLRMLLHWADAARRPDLAIVLVDEDGHGQRKDELDRLAETVPVTTVVAVAVREFEAWLIADADEVRALPGSVQSPPSVESLDPRVAKDLLIGWATGKQREERSVRVSLARSCRIEVLRERCPSFDRFFRELAAAGSPGTTKSASPSVPGCP